MKSVSLLLVSLLASPILLPPGQSAAQQEGAHEESVLRFRITGVEAERGGAVVCGLYANDRTWLNRSEALQSARVAVRRNVAVCVFRDVPPGQYAIAALHDENGDREMETSLFGIPQEGYAISRNEYDRMSAPDFDEAAFNYRGGRETFSCRINY